MGGGPWWKKENSEREREYDDATTSQVNHSKGTRNRPCLKLEIIVAIQSFACGDPISAV